MRAPGLSRPGAAGPAAARATGARRERQPGVALETGALVRSLRQCLPVHAAGRLPTCSAKCSAGRPRTSTQRRRAWSNSSSTAADQSRRFTSSARPTRSQTSYLLRASLRATPESPAVPYCSRSNSIPCLPTRRANWRPWLGRRRPARRATSSWGPDSAP